MARLQPKGYRGVMCFLGHPFQIGLSAWLELAVWDFEPLVLVEGKWDPTPNHQLEVTMSLKGPTGRPRSPGFSFASHV